LAVTDAVLYAKPVGEYDVWWGGRISDPVTMGNRYLYVTDKLSFDFESAQRVNILNNLKNTLEEAGGDAEQVKPIFTSSAYTHKLEIELNVDVPTGPGSNPNLYRDVILHSNRDPVKDKYFLFIRRSGTNLSILSINNPSWS
jgi:hypothetical protein